MRLHPSHVSSRYLFGSLSCEGGEDLFFLFFLIFFKTGIFVIKYLIVFGSSLLDVKYGSPLLFVGSILILASQFDERFAM